MNQTILIRKETPEDYAWVVELTRRAFESMPFSEGNEDQLVVNFHKSESFISELSLVAELNGQVVGHILFTPLFIENGPRHFESLVLAPVSVLPEWQNQGVGSLLIEAGHQKAKELGFNSIILVGHEHYYPRFGYKTASRWGIKVPFDLPSDDVFMALELTSDALAGCSGMVRFPAAFGLPGEK